MTDLLIKNGTVVDGTGAPPYEADIAITNGRITEIGRLNNKAHRTIDAGGLIVTPGFVDIHTHYDGQATWDPVLEPSFSNGVTTAVMGNCGVGFAPVKNGDEQRLIELMEGVEEIPGTALTAGMQWNWESFPEYLDVLAGMERSFDIAATVPHGALRAYVLGDKIGTNKCANSEELQRMSELLEEAMQAGAVGLSSSRTPLHRTATGDMTPDFDVDEPELLGLAKVLGRYNGTFEVVPLGNVGEDLEGLRRDMALFARIATESDARVHLLVSQTQTYPDYWREQLEIIQRANHDGVTRMVAQIAGRGVCLLMSFFNSNPFMHRPTYKAITELPRSQWLQEFAKPDVKAKILAEADPPEAPLPALVKASWQSVFNIGTSPNYEPTADLSIKSIAERLKKPEQEIAYDLMLENGDRGFLMAPILNYAEGNLEPTREMLNHPSAVLSASDAGAHVMTVCDGAIYSFMLTHWVRDRSRGERIPLPQMIKKMTSDPARSFYITDRGELSVGMKADINIIDMDRLRLNPNYISYDLPAGAGRLLQNASGYRATIVSGVITREFDEDTGARPGRLLRRGAA